MFKLKKGDAVWMKLTVCESGRCLKTDDEGFEVYWADDIGELSKWVKSDISDGNSLPHSASIEKMVVRRRKLDMQALIKEKQKELEELEKQLGEM